MRVISMVPSLTETLIDAGINVVGRTRFCVHPRAGVSPIPIVGGTKDIQWDRVAELMPDLLILDREENLSEMAKASPVPWIATHIHDLNSAAQGFELLAQRLESAKLAQIAQRWQAVSQQVPLQWRFDQIPGEIEKIGSEGKARFEKLVYVIWRNPWMAVSDDTFIGAVLKSLGAETYIPTFEKKYPEFDLAEFDLAKTYFLFSSEPYPFLKKKGELSQYGFHGASLVDGEKFSWFGIRTLRFLEEQHHKGS